MWLGYGGTSDVFYPVWLFIGAATAHDSPVISDAFVDDAMLVDERGAICLRRVILHVV